VKVIAGDGALGYRHAAPPTGSSSRPRQPTYQPPGGTSSPPAGALWCPSDYTAAALPAPSALLARE
jgi:hypothetical protein